MKKLFTLFIAITFFTSAKAQWVTIPDANFVTWLNTNIPSAMNGNQLNTSSTNIQFTNSLNCSNSNIIDLTGIQY
ncbi:MAG: hypothetical protein RL065_1636, partial [Bacteroidota bacterium]